MVTAEIAGLGAAVPGAARQDVLWDTYFREHFGNIPIARRIFESSGVRQRHSVIDPTAEDPSGWSTGARMRRYGAEAHPLGHRAVTAALAEAGVPAHEVDMLTVVSCTGYSTPGLDIELAASLGLRPDVERLLVGHMGCYAALPALASVSNFVCARDRTAVLLSVELTSLHLQPPTGDPEQIVSHALFGDAAVAAVLRPGSTPCVPRFQIVDIASHTDVSTRDHMTWEITDAGFRMGLSPQVPDVLAEYLRPVVGKLLSRNGLRPDEVGAWAVHPGGPRILDTVRDTLALPHAALAPSRAVLAEYGNCSSATLLLVIDRLASDPDLGSGAPVVALAFGPGLTLYTGLLRAG